MSVKVSVICFKSKVLANGEHPIVLRISENKKRVTKSLGISVKAQHWDFKKEEPKPKCPNRDLIVSIILKVKSEYQSKILEKIAHEEEFTASSLIHEEKEEIKAKTVEEFYTSLIEELKERGQIGTSYAYKGSYRVLKQFNKKKKLNFTFSHIDVSFCKKFEDWMRAKGNKDTTISFQLRTLRATFNRAIEAKIVAKDKNPFTVYKLSHLNTKTMKRALSKSDIMKIMQADCTDKTPIRQLAQDLFAFSYLCGGINLQLDGFYSSIYKDVKLYVPIGSKEIYNSPGQQLHYYLKKCGRITDRTIFSKLASDYLIKYLRPFTITIPDTGSLSSF